jgi:hypothetical protein
MKMPFIGSVKLIQLSYHGESHYNSVRSLNDPDIGQPAVHHSINMGIGEASESASSKSIAKVLQAAPWCSSEDIETALRITCGDTDSAIELLMTDPEAVSFKQNGIYTHRKHS